MRGTFAWDIVRYVPSNVPRVCSTKMRSVCPMTTMNRIEYARHAGVDRKTISRWIKAGKYIVLSGDDIDVEASDRAVALWRDSTDGRTKNASKSCHATVPESVPLNVTSVSSQDDSEDFVKAFMLANGADMSKDDDGIFGVIMHAVNDMRHMEFDDNPVM